MKIISQSVYKRNGATIREIQVKDITKSQAKEIRRNLLKQYSKVHMAPFEVYEDRPRLFPNFKGCKGYIFYIWLNSKIKEEST